MTEERRIPCLGRASFIKGGLLDQVGGCGRPYLADHSRSGQSLGHSAQPMSLLGHLPPAARRRAGSEVRSGPKADLIPTPWLMLLASLTEEHDHAVSSERDPRAP